ncbi:MAG TPA: hypothetical protein VG710_06405 [Opitutus sp.]|nr:hypothetical protein [Opitutus sp.]
MNASPTHGFINHLVVYTLVLIGLSGSVGLGAVWLRHQISLAANASRVLDARIADVERNLAETTTAVETERDPNILLRRDTEWHLGLVPPNEAQIVHVNEDPVMRLAAKRNRAVFGEGPGQVAVAFPLAAQR